LTPTIIKWKKIDPDAIIPKYAHYNDSGCDIHSLDDFELESGSHAIVRTGLAVEIPDGYEIQIRPRSGLAIKEGVTTINAPGTIDAGYRGEIKIILYKVNAKTFPFKTKINKGDRIAQGVVSKVYYFEFEEVDELNSSSRGKNGFGSTGT
jgi:dUTP pyrophosphatase